MAGTWYGNLGEMASKAGGLPNLIKQRNATFGSGMAKVKGADDRLPAALDVEANATMRGKL